MADISMCLNDSCRLKESCYRFQAVPNLRWQSYSGFQADGLDDKPCHAYWRIEPSDLIKLQERKKEIEATNR